MTIVVTNDERVSRGLTQLSNSALNTPVVADAEPGLFSRLAAKIETAELQFGDDGLSLTGRGIATGIGGGPGGESYTNLSEKLGLTPSSLVVQLERENLAGEADIITEYTNGLHILWRKVATSEADAALAQKKDAITRIIQRMTNTST